MHYTFPAEKITLFGAGGFAQEVLCMIIEAWQGTGINYKEMVCFAEANEKWQEQTLMGVPVIPESAFHPGASLAAVCIGDPALRKKVVDKLPADTRFATLIHPGVALSEWVVVEEGTIICAGSLLTCHIQLGRHTHLNPNTTIAHHCTAGDYFTTAPAVNVSGNCKFGHNVYLGTNAAIKNNLSVCSNVTIGMGSVVLQNITEPGIYAGNPARKLEKRT